MATKITFTCSKIIHCKIILVYRVVNFITSCAYPFGKIFLFNQIFYKSKHNGIDDIHKSLCMELKRHRILNARIARTPIHTALVTRTFFIRTIFLILVYLRFFDTFHTNVQWINYLFKFFLIRNWKFLQATYQR